MNGSVRGGHNYGVTGASGLVDEVKENRKYYPLVITGLQRNGFNMQDVTPYKTNTKSEDLSYGVNKANANNSDFFISCHLNSSDGNGKGCEVIYYPGSSKGKKLAEYIVNELASLGFKNRGAKADTRGLYELNHTKMTAVIVEPFFCDNAEDVALYKRVGAEGIANAIVNGVLKYYGKQPSKQQFSNVQTYYTLEFQRFYNKVTKTKAPIKEDGIFGPDTDKSYNTLGKLIRGEY